MHDLWGSLASVDTLNMQEPFSGSRVSQTLLPPLLGRRAQFFNPVATRPSVEKQSSKSIMTGLDVSGYSVQGTLGTFLFLDLEWAIGLNRLTLRINGLWPDPDQSPRSKMFSSIRTLIILLMIVLILAIPSVLSLARVWGDMLLMIDNLQVTLPLSMTVAKVSIMWWKKNELSPIVNMMRHDWIKRKTRGEREVMIKQAGRARGLMIFGLGLMILQLVLIVMLPCFGYSIRYITNLTDDGRPLLMQTYYPYDVTKTPYYEYTIFGQAASCAATAFVYTGIDNFLGLAVFHLCAQMENLARRFSNLHEYKDFNETFMLIVKDHIRLIRSVDIIENTFNLMLLGLLLYFSILFCFQGFLSVSALRQGDDASLVRLFWLATVTFNVFVHTAIYCMVSEVLISKNELIYHAAYNNEWYLLKPDQARSLILVMIRTDRPLYISAGKFIPMTMEMLCNLIKTSVGYVSVLLANKA